MAEKLFTEFPPVPKQTWEEAIIKDLKGADYQKKLVWKTMEGFSVQPYYRAEDLKDLKTLNSEAGQFPFIRGTKTNNTWLIRQDYLVMGNFKKANALALDGMMKGVTAVGYDLTETLKVSKDELRTLLKGFSFKAVEINFKGCKDLSLLRNFIAIVKEEGVKPADVRASFDYDPLKEMNLVGRYAKSAAVKQLREAIELSIEYPNISVIGIYAYLFNNAGSTITQELAYGMSMGSEYLNLLQEAGGKIDEFAPKMKFTFSISGNYFMEIAKFRAARLLWANIVKAYGAKKDNSCKIKVHAVTSAWNQTVYDPYVNMLRDTTEAMSGAIAGVDSMEVLPFDHAYKKAGEFSNRMARNIQSLLLDESHFDKVVDPSAGSYYIEELTQSVAQASWDLFKKVEEEGGYVECFKKESIQDAVKETALKRDSNIATRRDTLLGTNQFPNFTEVAEKEVKAKTVTRKRAPKKITGMVGRPFDLYRGAMAFEELRYKTDTAAKRPKAFMVTYGNLAMCRARAQFACNFFAVAGFEVVDNNRFNSPEEGAKAALKAKADIVVACSSDDEYANEVPQIAKIIGNKAIVVVAGEPECKEELISKGIDKFISVRSNVLETLKEYQQKLIK
ncbi:MAG: acyl-CoA mutase large subunit family protein [Bacteroidales bacterium]|nr:acyl-CoA mutase large subunit family protein [Bacteroidales bacterium]